MSKCDIKDILSPDLTINQLAWLNVASVNLLALLKGGQNEENSKPNINYLNDAGSDTTAT